jgi:hypothetical protein
MHPYARSTNETDAQSPSSAAAAFSRRWTNRIASALPMRPAVDDTRIGPTRCTGERAVGNSGGAATGLPVVSGSVSDSLSELLDGRGEPRGDSWAWACVRGGDLCEDVRRAKKSWRVLRLISPAPLRSKCAKTHLMIPSGSTSWDSSSSSLAQNCGTKLNEGEHTADVRTTPARIAEAVKRHDVGKSGRARGEKHCLLSGLSLPVRRSLAEYMRNRSPALHGLCGGVFCINDGDNTRLSFAMNGRCDDTPR